MINILYVNGGPMNRGGIESFMMNYFRHMDKSVIHIDFAVHQRVRGAYDDEIENSGSKIYYLPQKSRHPVEYSRELKALLSKREYQIVHTHMDAMGCWVLKVAKECGIPVRIAHSHNTNHLTTNKVKYAINEYARKRITKYSTHNFACSEEAGKWLFGENKFTVIPNAIELERFKFDNSARDMIRAEFGFRDDCFVFGNVARFDTQKNHEFLINSFSKVAKQCANARLLLVGDGWLMDTIREKVRYLGIENEVIFAGSRADVNKLYSAMDAFVLPSKFEGLVVVGIEAQANGLVSLVSDSVPHQVKISDLVTFIPLDEDKWVEQMVKLCEADRRHYEVDLSQSGYDIDLESKKLQQMYCEVVTK